MKLSEFDYELDKRLIATQPAEPRDAARLLVLNKKSGEMVDSHFFDLDKYLMPGDVLVFNDSKVIPARLKGKSGGREFEVLLVKNLKGKLWECWVRPGKKAKIGNVFWFSPTLSATLVKRKNEIFVFEFDLEGTDFFEEIEKIGQMPIPPYILKARGENGVSASDVKDYQTVFAKSFGSVAAPTAGLHFTEPLLEKLRNKGVLFERVTLHVSLGTFQPVNKENIEEFDIHSEYYELSAETATRLNQAKMAGKRIIPVGTTSVRVLESAAAALDACGLNNPCQIKYGLLPKSGETNIYIYPGYEFKFIDAMITNFHLPKSSLLLLVSAFAGKDNIMKAYQHAIDQDYLFYSYGDGMFIY